MKYNIAIRVLFIVILTLTLGCFLAFLKGRVDFVVVFACAFFGALLWSALFLRTTEHLPALNGSRFTFQDRG
jgi:hypothetical protein